MQQPDHPRRRSVEHEDCTVAARHEGMQVFVQLSRRCPLPQRPTTCFHDFKISDSKRHIRSLLRLSHRATTCPAGWLDRHRAERPIRCTAHFTPSINRDAGVAVDTVWFVCLARSRRAQPAWSAPAPPQLQRSDSCVGAERWRDDHLQLRRRGDDNADQRKEDQSATVTDAAALITRKQAKKLRGGRRNSAFALRGFTVFTG